MTASQEQDREALEEQIVELSLQGQDVAKLWRMRDRLLNGSTE